MRIAIYVLVSTLRQAQAQSIDQQISRLQDHVTHKGWVLLDEHIFRDDGRSGATLNRPGLDRLRDKVRMAEVDCVLVTSPDRLSRNFVQQMLLLEAAIVQQLFAGYLEDRMTLYTLVKRLYLQGVTSPTGKSRWSGASVRGVLTNPAYAGHVYLGRTRTQPPRRRRSPTGPLGRRNISQEEQFELVQAKLAHNIKGARRNNTAHDYLLRALVSCGACRIACTGRADGRHSYYFCKAKGVALTSPRDEKCKARYIPSRKLDELVWSDLCQVITQPEIIRHALERAWAGNWLPQELHARKENLRKGRAGVDSQIERLTQAYLSEIICIEEFQQRRKDLEQKRRGFEEQERQLQAQAERKTELAGVSRSIEEFCGRVQAGLENATFEQKRALVELLIDRVVVTDEEVEIRYMIPRSREGEQTRFCNLRKDYFNSHSKLVITKILETDAKTVKQ